MTRPHLMTRLHRALILATAALLSGLMPLGAGGAVVFAAETACTPSTNATSGIQGPTGADAATFSYQCAGPQAGKWTNSYYAYDPATGTRTPLYAPDYSYDCNTKTWTMAEWDYSPASGNFFPARVVAPSAPNLPTNCPTTPAAPDTATPATTGASVDPGTGGNPSPSPSAIAQTGPNSSNTSDRSLNTNAAATNDNALDMNNKITTQSVTGDSAVVSNTTGGSATSGDAQAVANIANLLQSTSNAFGPDTAVFTANINGSVNGDFMFDPNAILASGPVSSNMATSAAQLNVANTNNTGAAIHNDIDVGATSGDATVARNTNGGDATSGNATAVVNLMNLINSTVAAGQSFVGTININGDLNGDILLPPGVLDALLASTGPQSNNSVDTSLAANSTAANNVTLSSLTNVTSDARSGNARVADNTAGGNAASGRSNNNVTLLNLTGSNVIGKNSLLVFVNVLGQWVGMIMNAPEGTTAAELGGGVTSAANTGPGSNNRISDAALVNSALKNTADLAIRNDVNVRAHSGSANVVENTNGGSARSGDAKTAVNVLNMQGSNLSVSDWFGILFINVFGMWKGSFGINTSAGDPVLANPGSPANNPVQVATHQAMANSLRNLAGFVPDSGNGPGTGHGTSGDSPRGSGSSSPSGGAGSGAAPGANGPAGLLTSRVLGDSVAKKVDTTASDTKQAKQSPQHRTDYTMPLIGFVLAMLILVAGERDRLFHRAKK